MYNAGTLPLNCYEEPEALSEQIEMLDFVVPKTEDTEMAVLYETGYIVVINPRYFASAITLIFLSWDDSDLNLDLLLGEYTASDVESEDDYVPAAKTAKTPKEASTASACKSEREAIYQCPECDNTYSSVSGFRGHLRTKHSLSKIKGMYSK
ncbi:unnamed protein product [Mytilus coruscus]|uniref:C2H2-type domain-containing protein n=1 Tax=Mytilus coruscus TaxID=42192 RepID=A0A6J8AUG2_MYTCO|nr:unnamed protein product [Mytilus coruscus]